MVDKLTIESDKFYWHGYIPFYESFFAGRTISSIAEIGIFHGASIRWLLNRFPNSQIQAADILETQPDWPQDTRVSYSQVDQAQAQEVLNFFAAKKFDLVIEDGSHDPQHQTTSLLAGLPSVNKDGIYIIEDIHTSIGSANILSILLGIDHYRRIGHQVNAEAIAKDTTVDAETVAALDQVIDSIHMYKRTWLPDRCYNCGESEFNYSTYTCQCGTELYKHNDSMSCVIIRK